MYIFIYMAKKKKKEERGKFSELDSFFMYKRKLESEKTYHKRGPSPYHYQ